MARRPYSNDPLGMWNLHGLHMPAESSSVFSQSKETIRERWLFSTGTHEHQELMDLLSVSFKDLKCATADLRNRF